MGLKKAFTLVEIIVAMLILAVIAVITLTSLMKSVDDSKYKTAYKKANSAITNIVGIERSQNNILISSTEQSVQMFFDALNKSLLIKGYYEAPLSLEEEFKYESSKWYNTIDYPGNNQTTSKDNKTLNIVNFGLISPWIVTDDNTAYLVAASGKPVCKSKFVISALESNKEAIDNSCVYIVVDVNGLSKGPNRFDKQISSVLDENTQMNVLAGDRFYIFVGIDGATTASKKSSVEGRIIYNLR